MWTPGALDAGGHVRGIRAEPVVHREPVVVVGFADRHGDLFGGRVIVEDGELALLVDGECGVVESLVIGPGFHDVAHVPLADVDCVVAHVRQHLGERDLLARQPEAGDINGRLAHAVAKRLATGHEGDARRRA